MNLHEANQRLYALRAERGIKEQGRTIIDPAVVVTPPAQIVPHLPDHLGWDSDPLTRHLRAKFGNGERVGGNEESAPAPRHPFPIDERGRATRSPLLPPDPCPLTTLSPTLALTLLKAERVADGRLWLLLRALDKTGQGWLTRAAIDDLLTDTDSPHYLCGKRQLRKLLAQGNGVFWERDKRRVWWRRPSAVIDALGGEWVSGRLVELPVSVLRQPIGVVRAHLYAIFHSGRGESAGPISRATLTDLSGASARTQQAYETKAGVAVQTCVAIGAAVGTVDPQEAVWGDGRAGFIYTDVNGQHGAVGRQYHARRLPNQYIGPRTHQRRGRPRRLHHELALLSDKGRTGNGRLVGKRVCRYGRDGQTALRVWKKGATAVYWPSAKGRGGVQVWYTLEKL